MATITNSFFLPALVLALVTISPYCIATISDTDFGRSYQGKTWCTVKPGAPANRLQAFIDSTCGQFNCAAIRPGGMCFQPDNVQNHASYLLDLVFRSTNVCNAEIGLPAITDPSFGSCRFP